MSPLPPHPLRSGDPVPIDPTPVDRLPTPALVVDVPALERNLLSMQRHAERHGVAIRPHAKTHRCPEIGRRQLAGGAIGLCCAKVGEAEAMAASGLGPLLVTSPIVTADLVRRAVDLATRNERTTVVADSERGVRLLAEHAEEAGVDVRVLLDLDPGTHRTGVAPGEAARALAREIAARPRLRLDGLQAYAGHLMHVRPHAERKSRALELWQEVLATRRLLEADGHRIEVLSGGGTGTYDIDIEVPGLTDLQVGSYVFMDREYREIGSADAELLDTFETSLFVVATAISQPVPYLITVDAGFKAFATDAGTPEPLALDGVVYHWGGDEHGILELREPSRPLALGDTIRFRTPHCDPTVNLYDGLWAAWDDVAREWWPIAARGRSS